MKAIRDIKVFDDPQHPGGALHSEVATEERRSTFLGMNREVLRRSLLRQSLVRAGAFALAFALLIAGSPIVAYVVLAGSVISSLARAIEYDDLK